MTSEATREPRLVRAGPALAPELTRVAIEAKASWGYPAAWIESWRDALAIAPEYVREHPVWAAVEGERILGFYGLAPAASPRPDRLRLEHLWIRPEAQRRGLGTALLAHASREARSLGARVLEIEADPIAEAFYRAQGAIRVGAIPADRDGVRRSLPLMELVLS